MYGIGAVKYKGEKVGYIAKNTFDLGGVKPEAASRCGKPCGLENNAACPF